MKPSEVRSRILQDHERLRLGLAELEALVAAVGDGRSAAILRDRLRTLLAFLEGHLSLEDQILFPAIRAIDAWGPQRATRLQDHHAQQRQELSRLACLERQVGDGELCEAVRGLAIELRDDMHKEETELLDPELLRDDLVNINQFGG